MFNFYAFLPQMFMEYIQEPILALGKEDTAVSKTDKPLPLRDLPNVWI